MAHPDFGHMGAFAHPGLLLNVSSSRIAVGPGRNRATSRHRFLRPARSTSLTHTLNFQHAPTASSQRRMDV
jgi:hypothetical protein